MIRNTFAVRQPGCNLQSRLHIAGWTDAKCDSEGNLCYDVELSDAPYFEEAIKEFLGQEIMTPIWSDELQTEVKIYNNWVRAAIYIKPILDTNMIEDNRPGFTDYWKTI